MQIFDPYTFRARIQPALVVVLPLGFVMFALLPGHPFFVTAFFGLLGAAGGTAVVAQVGRELGRKKEPNLWKSWGGPPTTRLLRFRDSPDQIVLHQWRAKIERLMGYSLPSRQEEAEDLAAADQKYEVAVSFLRESTRDTSKFPLVFAENINYGFRRNLWGMKPYGLGVALLATVCCWGVFLSSVGLHEADSLLVNMFRNPDGVVVTRLIGSILNTAITAAWLLVISPQWVRTAAEAYAQSLLRSVDALDPNPLPG